jgi:hypothetical protein
MLGPRAYVYARHTSVGDLVVIGTVNGAVLLVILACVAAWVYAFAMDR